MAEKIDSGDKPSSSLQNLTCPLCLDIFDEATLLNCKHTFCRKCLKKYDLSHQNLDYMECPLCREITKLSSNRVQDLPANVNVNELVNDYHSKSGGVNAVLEIRPKCTSCDFQADAVAFCRTCNSYICDECLHNHQHLKVFRGHEIVSIQDIIEGKVSIGRSSEKCSKHTQEDKDLFCDNCKIHVCHKCVIVGHRDHTVKNQDDFERELQLKVNDLGERCSSKKSELEKNIHNLEGHRQELHATMQKLRTEVLEAYSTKAKQLEENQRILIEQIDALEHEFNDDLDALKSSDRQKIKSIYSSMDLVANDRLGRLEAESLSAHILLCEELESILKEATDHISAAVINEKAQKKKFKPADDTRLDLGEITEPRGGGTSGSDNESGGAPIVSQTKGAPPLPLSEPDVPPPLTEPDPEPSLGAALKESTNHSSPAVVREKAHKKKFKPADDTRLDLGKITEPDRKPSLGAMVKESTDHSSAAVVREKVHKKKFKPADNTRLDLGSISAHDPVLQVIHSVDLRDSVWGMTKYSAGSAAVGYLISRCGIDIVESKGNIQPHAHLPSDIKCFDLAFQSDRTLCISTIDGEIQIYYPNGSKMKTIQTNKITTMNVSPTDEIILADIGKEVRIYDKTGSTVKHTVSVRHVTRQASATRTGLIIASSCYPNPSIMTVYDRNGNAGKPLQAPSDVYLYAAVDEQDRVYVASVDCKNGKVVIRLYDIDGLNLKERVEFNELNLTLEWEWCHLVSLSPNLLAFLCKQKLYFIKVSM